MNIFSLTNDLLEKLEPFQLVENEQSISEPKNEQLHTHTDDLFCNSCDFVATERAHFKTDFHRYNLKRKLKGLKSVTEDEFDDLEEMSSIEGSEDDDEELTIPQKEGSPFVTFPFKDGVHAKKLLVFKQLLASKPADEIDWFERLREIQLKKNKQKNLWGLLLLSSGHFSAAILDLDNSGTAVVHKTFHRYTTRRKQGGAQSSNDKSKGKAKSAGAGIRRYNEQALQEEIQDLITSWKDNLSAAKLIFVRAPGNMKKILFFNPSILDGSDARVRSFPFITKRPTLSELNRCYNELSLTRIEDFQEDIILQVSRSKISPESKSRHQLLDGARKGNIEVVRETLQKNNFNINDQDFDGSLLTILHLAASHSQSEMVNWLLENGADPSLGDKKNTKPYDLADAKETRNVFRRFVAKYPERWDWRLTNIPGPLTEEMERQATAKEQEKKKRQKEKRIKEKVAAAPVLGPEDDTQFLTSSASNLSISQPVIKKNQKEMIGMTPEMRQRLDREKRALAAEARARSVKNMCGNCGNSLSGLQSFDKSVYRYCSMECLKTQHILF